MNRGVVNARRGDAEAARRDFEAALLIAPENVIARSNLAALGTGQQQVADAARAESERQQAARAEAERVEQERSAAAAREAGARAEAERRERERLGAERDAEAQAEAERKAAEAVRLEQERLEAERRKALTRRAQLALAVLGFNVGQADGTQGRRTRDALASYRKRAGLPAEPELSEAFVAGLEADAVGLRQRRLAEGEVREKAEAEKRAEAETLAQEAKRRAEAERTAEAARRADAERQAAEVEEEERKAEAERLAAAVASPPADTAEPAPAAEIRPLPSPSVATPADGKRVALVIGNGAYRTANPLPNPPNDAADMAAALARLGFTVLKGLDLDRLGMEDLAAEFARAAADADIAVVFFAGHGLQVRDVNYLVPVDGRLQDEVDLRRLPRLDDIIDDASRARRLGIVVVDACRNNPLVASLKRSMGASRAVEVGGGLAPPSIPRNQTLVAYATAAKDVAVDGAGRNSPFTAALLEHLASPEDVRLVFGRVRDAVVAATDGGQRPEIWGSLGGERISLAPAEASAEQVDAALTPSERQAVQRSLKALGHYRGDDDGRFSPAVRAGVRDFQLSQAAPATGYLAVPEMVALHELARYRRPPEPLPAFDLIGLLRRSEAGEPEAQRLRGMLHDDGFASGGLPKDQGEAARWYERAAAAGDALAAERLGWLLKTGDQIDEDAAGAARWLAQAAAAGRVDALLGLAELHEQGSGVPRDRDEAVRLYRRAAEDPAGGPAIAKLRALNAWQPAATAAAGPGTAPGPR